jgi:hypothetical protein
MHALENYPKVHDCHVTKNERSWTIISIGIMQPNFRGMIESIGP